MDSADISFSNRRHGIEDPCSETNPSRHPPILTPRLSSFWPTKRKTRTGGLENKMTKSKGTNSLAFARTDCHTCVSAARTCDRRRPQCLTCRELGVKCGGFATPLSWDNNRIWLGQPSQKKVYIYDGNRAAETSSKASSSRTTFRFVNGSSRRKRRRRLSPATSPHVEHRRLAETHGQGVGIESYLGHPHDSLIDDFGKPPAD